MHELKVQDLSITLIDMSIEMLSTIGYKKIFCDTKLQLLKYEKSILLERMLCLECVKNDLYCLGRIELAIKHLERKSNSFIINDFDK
jgi:hypothetical protein